MILVVFGASIIPTIHAQEPITFSEYKAGNQTVTYVNVTVGNGVQGAAMITSAIILGFIGFSSALEFTRFTNDRKDQKKMILAVSICIIIILLIQFFIIIQAFSDNLDESQYTLMMIITLIVFIFLLVLLNAQSGWYTKQGEDAHAQKARFHDILDETSKTAIG